MTVGKIQAKEFDPPSRAVSVLATLNAIMGAVSLSPAFGFFGAIVFGGLDLGSERPKESSPPWALGLSSAFLFWSAGMIASSVGLFDRKTWARRLSLVLGAFSLLTALVGIAWLVYAINSSARPEEYLTAIGLALAAPFLLGYGTLALVVLLPKRVKSDFH